MSITGSCLCGSVAYRVARLAGPIVHCHCQTCRKAHASAFSSTARVNREDFSWLQGEDQLVSFESSPGKVRRFCMRCGAHLVAEREGDPQLILRVATLDQDPGARPVAAIWRSHDVAWLQDGPELASFDEVPASPS